MINYYIELGVDPKSSLEEIKASIKATRRRYRTLTGSPNIDQRSMAERKMVILAEAEKVFSDESSRKKYDNELANASNTENTGQAESERNEGVSDLEHFIDRSRSAYEVGNLKLAFRYSEEATKIDRSSFEAWKLQATIAQELNMLTDAVMACTEAAYLKRNDAEIFGLLGDIHRTQKNYKQAIKDFDNAFQHSSNYYWKYQKAMVLYDDDRQIDAAELLVEIKDQFEGDARSSILKSAAVAYQSAGRFETAKSILKQVAESDPTYENRLTYAESLSGQEAVDYVEQMYPEYSRLTNMQILYTESLISNFIEQHGQYNSVVLDSKVKCEAAKTVLNQLKVANLTASAAIKRVEELEQRYKEAVKRRLEKTGCSNLIIVFLIFYFVKFIVALFIGDFLGFCSGVAAVIYYILHYVYPTGWMLNKRKK